MLQQAGQKQSFERSLGQTYLLILESLLERQGAMVLTLGTSTLEAAILRSWFHHKDTDADKGCSGVLP